VIPFHKTNLLAFNPGMSGIDPLYAFLPLALAGMPTAVICSLQRFVGPFPIATKVFSKTIHLKKEQLNEAQHLSAVTRIVFPFGCFAPSSLAAQPCSTLRPHTPRRKRPRCREVFEGEHCFAVHAKLRFQHSSCLPGDEDILDFTTCDKEFWASWRAQPLLCPPAQAGIPHQSEPSSAPASGHFYSFCSRKSQSPNAEPDLKRLWNESRLGVAANSGLRGYVSAGEARRIRGNSKPPLPTADKYVLRRPRRVPPRRSPFSLHLRNETPVRLSPRPEGGKRAHSYFAHLPRRLIHLYQVLLAGKPLSMKSRTANQT